MHVAEGRKSPLALGGFVVAFQTKVAHLCFCLVRIKCCCSYPYCKFTMALEAAIFHDHQCDLQSVGSCCCFPTLVTRPNTPPIINFHCPAPRSSGHIGHGVLSRSSGGHAQREGTNLGVFVLIWLVLSRCEATNLGVFDLRHFDLLERGCTNSGGFGAR